MIRAIDKQKPKPHNDFSEPNEARTLLTNEKLFCRFFSQQYFKDDLKFIRFCTFKLLSL